ncbi:hypothetical protein RZS08_06420 [Arthrospira platensis SPKY1]|nr:hypothetical protein [Arthrospira platensis SPKY1]
MVARHQQHDARVGRVEEDGLLGDVDLRMCAHGQGECGGEREETCFHDGFSHVARDISGDTCFADR